MTLSRPGPRKPGHAASMFFSGGGGATTSAGVEAADSVLAGAEARGEAAHETIERYTALRRELIGVERGAILGLRNDGRLRQDTMRLIQRDLDLEEARLPS